MMAQRAQGYTPAVIYATASGAIIKHQLVYLSDTAGINPVTAEDTEPAIGFALQDAQPGEGVPVQIDGVIYDWAGADALAPGSTYYQGIGGGITDSPSALVESPWPVGVAVNTSTFLVRIGAGGGSVGGSSNAASFIYDEEYITVTQQDCTNKYIRLGRPVYTEDSLLSIILGGGSIHLLPDVDYTLTKSSPSLLIFDVISWAGLPDSILHRLCPDDYITLVRNGAIQFALGASVVFLANGQVQSEGQVSVTILNSGVASSGTRTPIGIETANA